MRLNPDSLVLHQEAVEVTKVADHLADVVASEAASEVAWRLHMEVEDVKFTSPTFVPKHPSPWHFYGIEYIDFVI